ncbi:energy transducer TonB [Blastomonas sp.]|uniref:energy transducer TonB n=1 Tax=Blastomonas sp. TaxID=1909299 RepID=UPI00406A995C
MLNLFAVALGISLICTAITGPAIASRERQGGVAPTGKTRAAAIQAAKPRNDASTWITLQDYPTDTRHEGVTRYRLLIATTGRVAQCEITESSGSRWLDEATCRNLVRRARFHPATNSQGKAIEGRYEAMMRWYIPD